jgi:ubiquinone/menaquinone biosynthesis C-methylase UbiE
MASTQSAYIEKKSYLSGLAHEKELAFRETEGHLETEFGSEAEWERCVREVFPAFVPFLTQRCGLYFRGRILEIGAGTCWFSGELSKITAVQEILATDFSPKLLKDFAPKVFGWQRAAAAKITRMPGDFHQLDLPANHYDFIVCSAVVHHAVDPVAMLREVRRMLRPDGRFVAIREPVLPALKLRKYSKTQSRLIDAGVNEHIYKLAEYRKFFEEAGLQLQVKRVNLATGMKFAFNEMVNGLTHARYAFIGMKRA